MARIRLTSAGALDLTLAGVRSHRLTKTEPEHHLASERLLLGPPGRQAALFPWRERGCGRTAWVAVNWMSDAPLLVNGEPLAEPVALIAGDELTIDESTLRFLHEPGDALGVEAWLSGDLVEGRVELGEENTVGRSVDVTHRTSNPHVGMRHLAIRYREDGSFVLEILGRPISPTTVVGARVHGPVALSSGEVIAIGAELEDACRLRFVVEDRPRHRGWVFDGRRLLDHATPVD